MAKTEMKHMQMTETERQGPMAMPAEKRDKYPYGLRLHLTEAEVKKLGMEELPEPGDTLDLHAVVKVSGSHVDEEEGGGKRRSLELQITHMGFESKEEMDREEQAQKLYPAQGRDTTHEMPGVRGGL